eukprot:TRINITY_DN8739_c0_g1_i13.p2 TRINITY_DN8739_c0_g1~~TRINITY_DN8739_c0_g1_i13.p2  ORF type:complete len:112 (-),score=0.94 TRINITY_DN8739_c0_g1_i13:156-491(-)
MQSSFYNAQPVEMEKITNALCKNHTLTKLITSTIAEDNVAGFDISDPSMPAIENSLKKAKTLKEISFSELLFNRIDASSMTNSAINILTSVPGYNPSLKVSLCVHRTKGCF